MNPNLNNQIIQAQQRVITLHENEDQIKLERQIAYINLNFLLTSKRKQIETQKQNQNKAKEELKHETKTE